MLVPKILTTKSLFNRVINNAKNLINAGINVDLKCLINPLNDNLEAMDDLFNLVRNINGRMLYFRPAIINGQAHPISPQTLELLKGLSEKYNLRHLINTSKTLPRNYKKCHQMFQFPVFCADGKIYLCCENKGNPQFALGSWDQDDFRDIWLKQRHLEIYDKTNVAFCQPCRPNLNNIEIQKILDNPTDIEILYM